VAQAEALPQPPTRQQRRHALSQRDDLLILVHREQFPVPPQGRVPTRQRGLGQVPRNGLQVVPDIQRSTVVRRLEGAGREARAIDRRLQVRNEGHSLASCPYSLLSRTVGLFALLLLDR
jgi:hypothetical protein